MTTTISKPDQRSIKSVASFFAAAVDYAGMGRTFEAGRQLGIATQMATEIDDVDVRDRAHKLALLVERHCALAQPAPGPHR